MHRQYTVTVTCDLFGTPLVVCRWGRIGTAGQVREHVCATAQEAEKMAACLLEAKKRRGYGAGQGAAVAPQQPAAHAPDPALSKHLPDLATVIEQRRAPLLDADRMRRLNMTIGMMRAYAGALGSAQSV